MQVILKGIALSMIVGVEQYFGWIKSNERNIIYGLFI